MGNVVELRPALKAKSELEMNIEMQDKLLRASALVEYAEELMAEARGLSEEVEIMERMQGDLF